MKKKRTLISVLLAFVLLLSNLASPIKLAADYIFSATAKYESTSVKKYHTESTSTTISITTSTIDELKEYFSESSANLSFEAKFVYDKIFEEEFADEINKILSDGNENFDEFLGNFENIKAYYENTETDKFEQTTFRAFAEYLVLNDVVFDEENSLTLNKIYTNSNKFTNLSNYYNDIRELAEERENILIPQDDDSYDNIPTDASEDFDFYSHSYTYTNINTFLSSNSPLFNYAEEGSDKVLAIIAKDAPTTLATYYSSEFEKITLAELKALISDETRDKNNFYEQTTKATSSAPDAPLNRFYTFEKSDFENKDDDTKLYFSIFANESSLDYFDFELLTDTASVGYIADKEVYRKYAINPYSKNSNGTYEVFVANDIVTADDQATYDYFGYTVISSEEANSGEYFKIPYSEERKEFFSQISGFEETSERFTNYVSTFAPTGSSKLYLKYVPYNKIYVLSTSQSNFENDRNCSFKMLVEIVDTVDTEKNYVQATTSSNPGYTSTNFQTYFKKQAVAYTTSQTVAIADTYETYKTGKKYFEQEVIASENLSNVFVALPKTETEETTATLNNKTITLITSETLADNPNLYSLVPTSLVKSIVFDNPAEYSDETENYTFYQKHQTIFADKIFVVDDDVTDTETKVYKTLNYNVISSQTVKDDYEQYFKIESDDENYNESFKLYYHFDQTKTNFAKNKITDKYALFVLDESLENYGSSEKSTLVNASMLTIITKKEAESGRYFKLEDDTFDYTLYYRYADTETVREIYEYTSAKESDYNIFYNTDEDFNKDFYVQIQSNDENYKEGKELFYKLKTKTTESNLYKKVSYYGYTTTDNLTLDANAFYVVSYYVNTTGENVKASVYVNDADSKLETVKIENISTNSNWQKHYMFISTGATKLTNVTLSMFMGTRDSLVGNGDNEIITSLSGSALFAGIEITKINQTDFNKSTVDDKSVPDDLKDAGNRDVLSLTRKFDFGSELKLDLLNASTDFESIVLPAFSIYANGTDISNGYVDGYAAHDKIMQYFVSRELEQIGKSAEKLIVQKAYENGDLVVSIENENTFNKETKTITNDDETEDTEEITYETFNAGNKALKLENKNTSKSLGVAIKDFNIKQNEYYKLTVWVFSDKENSSATITLQSSIKTAQKPELGETLSKSVTTKAHLADYGEDSTQTNEYGWIPVTIFIQGNALHNQTCSLALLADTASTVYFDNITLEKASYTDYSSASNQFSLTPANSVLYKGVKNGYFNYVATENATLAENYTTPKKARDWTESEKFDGITAGIIATSKDYIADSDGNDFFTAYADGDYPFDKNAAVRVQNNIYAIHSEAESDFKKTNNYSINQKLSLTSNTVYEISYEFYIAENFSGNMVAKLYYDSMTDDTILESFTANKIELNSLSTGWNKFTFYIATSLTTSPSIYLEIGVSDALGTAFIRNVKLVSVEKAITEIRDELVTATETAATDIYSSAELFNIKFVDFSEKNFSIHAKTAENGVYESKDYKQTAQTIETATAGKTGIVVASYYTSEEEITNFVTINSTNYYIFKDSSDDQYKLYKYNDKNAETNEEITDIGGKSVKVDQDDLTVTVGKNSGATDYEVDEIIENKYDYKFKTANGYYVLNGTIIDANEFENAQSDSVMILANGHETDFTVVEPIYTDSLTASNYYVLKFYVKTSEFEEGKGLSVKIPTIPTWKEDYLIDTTKIASDDEFIDEFGFVCYQVLINLESTVSKLAVNFSLGQDDNTTSGYALISSVTLEKIASEDEFTHYADNLPDDGKIVKKFVKEETESTASNDSDETKAEMNWATFFYIFSSLLLVAVTVLAIVAVIFKKHPIKASVKAENEHDKNFEPYKASGNENIDQTEEQKQKKIRKKKSDDGIV